MSADDWKDFEEWSDRINSRRLQLPPSKQIRFIKQELAGANPKWRIAATNIFFSTCDAMNREEKLHERNRELRYFWLGVFLLVACIGLALFAPVTRPQIFALQLCGSLGAAALLAFMPGMLAVDLHLKEKGSWLGGKIRGTSASAAFVIVWLILPSLVRNPK
jgi:hypothetical protein